jgi:hypothetical protein
MLKTLPYTSTSLHTIDIELSTYVLVAKIEEDPLVK